MQQSLSGHNMHSNYVGFYLVSTNILQYLLLNMKCRNKCGNSVPNSVATSVQNV